MEALEETFAQIVGDYVQEKRATGYRFDKGAQMLRRIVDIQEEIDHGAPRLSRELVERWIEKTPWENETNRSHRISALRGLGVYMVRMGYDAIIVPQSLTLLKDYAYTPYIFSDRELGSLLGTVDQLCATGISTHSDLIFPLVFRILIGCGSRITETLQIEKKDVDVERGTLSLRITKNRKERIIPMAESLVNKCRRYVCNSQSIRSFNSSRWFFPNKERVPYHSATAYGLYRKALRLSGISHGGRGKGPRLHDLRHTFAVRVLNKWVRDGKNLTTALPYLAIYMGHEGLKACQHYLRLTAVMFPELIRIVEKEYGWIIPEAYHE
ncbi:MAG: tyrosine-type recombinase/integrase [Deltaproteobacteria bacterium]|nr:tyrosine-type recombinase/integrase [Deltaproteobacteria bacterium]